MYGRPRKIFTLQINGKDLLFVQTLLSKTEIDCSNKPAYESQPKFSPGAVSISLEGFDLDGKVFLCLLGEFKDGDNSKHEFAKISWSLDRKLPQVDFVSGDVWANQSLKAEFKSSIPVTVKANSENTQDITITIADSKIEVTAKKDGDYPIQITFTAKNGMSINKDLLFHYDTIAPLVVGLNDIYNVTGPIEINLNVETGAKVKWQPFDASNLTFAPNDSAKTMVSAPVDGSYFGEVIVTDRAGNARKKIFKLIMDKYLPAIEGLSYYKFKKNVVAGNEVATIKNATSYTWSKKSGPGDIAFSDINAMYPSMTFSEVGTYEITVAVQDDNSNTATKDITVLADWIAPAVSSMKFVSISGASSPETDDAILEISFNEAMSTPTASLKVVKVSNNVEITGSFQVVDSNKVRWRPSKLLEPQEQLIIAANSFFDIAGNALAQNSFQMNAPNGRAFSTYQFDNGMSFGLSGSITNLGMPRFGLLKNGDVIALGKATRASGSTNGVNGYYMFRGKRIPAQTYNFGDMRHLVEAIYPPSGNDSNRIIFTESQDNKLYVILTNDRNIEIYSHSETSGWTKMNVTLPTSSHYPDLITARFDALNNLILLAKIAPTPVWDKPSIYLIKVANNLQVSSYGVELTQISNGAFIKWFKNFKISTGKTELLFANYIDNGTADVNNYEVHTIDHQNWAQNIVTSPASEGSNLMATISQSYSRTYTVDTMKPWATLKGQTQGLQLSSSAIFGGATVSEQSDGLFFKINTVFGAYNGPLGIFRQE